MKALSLFSGIGGFDLALKRLGHEIVGACEIDEYARQIYARHFPGVTNHPDATKINAAELPDFDILCAGFPCQAFSIAGKRRGFDDTRGSLFFEIARIAKEKRPSILLLENVKGLLSHDKGETFRTIIRTLDEVGYNAEWQLLNSKYFVPQNRERVFIVGHLRGKSGRQIFPISESNTGNVNEKPNRESQSQPYSTAIDANYHKGPDGKRTMIKVGNIDTKGHNSLWGRVYDPNGISATLNAHGGGLGAKTGLYAVVKDHGKLRETKNEALAIDANYYKGPDNHGQRTMIAKAIPTLCVNREHKRQNGRRFKEHGEPSFTINTIDQHGIYDGTRIRRLTPMECERLQGFPDNWTAGLSDTQRYKCCGNAVTVPVVEYIIKELTGDVNNGN